MRLLKPYKQNKSKKTTMKIQKIAFTLAMVMALSSFGFAQNFDSNRMSRDIRIMENILNELFRYNHEVRKDEKHLVVAQAARNTKRAKGTYLPGYGVVFQVSGNDLGKSVSVNVERVSGQRNISYAYNFETDDEDNKEKASNRLSDETVIERITEFLRDYALNINQLEINEKVLVIYGIQPNLFGFNVYSLLNEKSETDNQLISISVSKKDIDALRSRQIDEKTFRDRISIEKSESKEASDLRVLGSIFETALKDGSENGFRISGKVHYLYLDNFGVLYNMDVRFNRGGNVYALAEEVKIVGSSVVINQRDSAEVSERKDKLEKHQKEVLDAFEKLKADVKEYLVDYGRTLRSLKSDQHIWLNINLSQSWLNVDLPDMIEVQVKKSVLEQYDRGDISREKALEQVRITSY